MSGLPTPRLVDLDDPLGPGRKPTPTPAESTRPAPAPRRATATRPTQQTAPAQTAAPSLAEEQLVAVFARMPESLSDRLADGVRALNAGRPRRGRVSQQDLLGALVDHYVKPDEPASLGELVDVYRQRIRR